MKRGLFQRLAWLCLPRSLENQLLLLMAFCLVLSILGYGAYTAKRQTELARQTITAQMAALAQNLATIDAHFLATGEPASIEKITVHTATVPGIFLVLVTDLKGRPINEIVNNQGQWSPRFSSTPVPVPAVFAAQTQVQTQAQLATQWDFLTGSAGILSAWHPVAADQALGWVRVSYRLDSFEETAREIWRQALLVIVLAITATLWLLLRLLRPTMRALRSATRFAADLDHTLGAKLEVSGQASEIEALGKALNLVSARLLTQSTDLQDQKFALDQHAIVSITDLLGTITYANDRFCAVSGYSREELLGQNHRIVKSGFHEPYVFVDLWQTITSGKVWHHEIKNRRKDGSFYWVDATMVPLLDAEGHPQQFIGIRTDITAIKELEYSLQQAKASAEAATLAKSEFLANMSHEIRTPMNGVIGMTELALGTELDETQRKYLNTVKSSAESLMVILNDILDFSKIEAGKLNIESIEFALADSVAEILAPIRSRAHVTGLVLAFALAPDLPERVRGDPGRIRQILTNLCDNTIKFTPHGSITVELACETLLPDSVEAHFSVHDTGIGIAADKLQGIFEAFTQADTSTTRRFGGTGLGLTICARLAELMGGRIWVESVPQQGSRFHFTVRLERRLTNRIAAPALPTLPAPASAQRALQVLLAEDHPVNQMLATTLLKKWGHQVALAENGQQALDLFPTQHWDIVLMDMQMPVMGGLEATTLIRQREDAGHHTPIIAVTANAMEADRTACLAAGMDGFLAKPINASALQALLAQHSATDHPQNT